MSAALVDRAIRLLAGIDPHPPKALVHGDYFPGNLLMSERLEVSAVIDFSVFTLVGDPLLDAACAVVFLEMNEPFTDADCGLVRSPGARALRRGARAGGAASTGPISPSFSPAPITRCRPIRSSTPWSLENLAKL